MRVIYVGGSARSGTTLLERLLGALPGVCALGEVTQVWSRVGSGATRCGCGAAFADCPFWTAVGEQAFGGWAGADPARVPALQRCVGRTRHVPRFLTGRTHPRRRALLTEYADYYARLYAAAAAASGCDTLVDSSKNPGLAYSLRYAPDLDLRIVHLVRDPRGVAHSWTRHLPGSERTGTALRRLAPPHSALRWDVDNAAMSLLARIDRVHRLRYEDLITAPRQQLRALARYAGRPVTEDELAFLDGDRARLTDHRPAATTAHHPVAGNPRLYQPSTVALRPDQAWRTALPRRHRALVTTVCAPLLAAYRYPVAAGHATGRHNPQ